MFSGTLWSNLPGARKRAGACFRFGRFPATGAEVGDGRNDADQRRDADGFDAGGFAQWDEKQGQAEVYQKGQKSDAKAFEKSFHREECHER